MTCAADIQTAAAVAADVIGIVIEFPRSPRSLPLDQGLDLAASSPIPWVPVLVDPPRERIGAILQRSSPYAVQLSGAESPETVRGLRRSYPGLRIWKAIHLETGGSQVDMDSCIRAATRYLDAGVSALVVDAKHPTLPGGTGLRADWTAARALTGALGALILLAGGLSPGNVCPAIQQVRPAGVDVSSGIESSPGVKDPTLMRAFVEQARAGFASVGCRNDAQRSASEYGGSGHNAWPPSHDADVEREHDNDDGDIQPAVCAQTSDHARDRQ
jgi:phosphoribosylanthranilate isomerase